MAVATDLNKSAASNVHADSATRAVPKASRRTEGPTSAAQVSSSPEAITYSAQLNLFCGVIERWLSAPWQDHGQWLQLEREQWPCLRHQLQQVGLSKPADEFAANLEDLLRAVAKLEVPTSSDCPAAREFHRCRQALERTIFALRIAAPPHQVSEAETQPVPRSRRDLRCTLETHAGEAA